MAARKNSPKGVKLTRYTRLVSAYKMYESERLGIPPSKVKVKGTSQSAAGFKDFYHLLTAKKKPGNWKQQLGQMGFGRGFWVLYKENNSSTPVP